MRLSRQPAARSLFAALAPLAAIALLLISISCGGGGGGGSSSGPPPPPPQPLQIVTSGLPDGVQARPYSVALQATGGTGALTWSYKSGNLPDNLYVMPSGHITTDSLVYTGTFSFEVEAKDSGNPVQTASKTLSLRSFARLFVETGTLPGGQLNQPYSRALNIAGGNPPYAWALAPGSTLPGFTLDSQTGVLSGVLSAAGPTSFTVQATDSASPPQTASGTLSLAAAPPLSIQNSSFPDGKVGRGYAGGMHGFAIYLNTVGGTPSVTWSISAGSLPPGVRIAVYQLTGTPTTVGTFQFTLQATDSSIPPLIATKDYTVRIDDLIIASPTFPYAYLPRAVVSRPINASAVASGGVPPYSWSICSSGQVGCVPQGLPPGISFDSASGLFSGTPSSSGFFGFELEVVDSSSPPLSDRAFSGVTINPLPAFVTTTLVDGVVGRAYSQSIQVAGGLPPLTFSLAAGSLPPGTSLPTSPGGMGAVFGNPTTIGAYSFTLDVSDSSSPPLTASQSLSIRVSDPLVWNTTSLPNGLIGDTYDFPLSVSGGFLPYTWQIAGGGLPNGLALHPSTGVITGAPLTTANAKQLMVSVSDSSNPPQIVSLFTDLTVNSKLFLATSQLPDASVGAPYEVTLVALGGIGPPAWSISNGNLPAGLSLGPADGVISGTSTQAESQTFTVQVADAATPPNVATRTLSLTAQAQLGRNDSPATATPISSGTFRASISPADDSSGTLNPDNDYYKVVSYPGTVVTVEIKAARYPISSPLDSIIEIVDTTGARLSYCDDFKLPSFNGPCMNDDSNQTSSTDSYLSFRAQGAVGTPYTFYVRVLDWSGMARPDFLYTITITGAN